MSGDYRAGGFSVLPAVVKNLLIINGLMFLAMVVVSMNFQYDLNDLLGLHYPSSEKFAPYQLISYMFMHGSFPHLFFNMFAVWMFGSAIESTWGPKRFLTYYLLTGLGAALTHYVVIYFQIDPVITQIENYLGNPDFNQLSAIIASHRFYVDEVLTPHIYPAFIEFQEAVNTLEFNPGDNDALNTTTGFMAVYLEHFKNVPNVVGASGSLFGILLAFGMLYPNARLFIIFFPVPIKAKYFVIGYGVIELISGLQNNPDDNVAHFAHLGGMLFGFLLIKLWGIRPRRFF